MTEQTKPPTLTPAEVQNEIVNDSLGTVDPADTTDTDPKDDPAAIADSASDAKPVPANPSPAKPGPADALRR